MTTGILSLSLDRRCQELMSLTATPVRAAHALWGHVVIWWKGVGVCEEALRALRHSLGRGQESDELSHHLLTLLHCWSHHHREFSYRHLGRELKALLSSLPATLLDDTLSRLVVEECLDRRSHRLEEFLSLLPFDKLWSAFRRHCEAEGRAFETEELAQAAAMISKHYPLTGECWSGRLVHGVKEQVSSVTYFLRSFVKTILNTFMQAHDFSTEDEEASDKWDAAWRLTSFVEMATLTLAAAGWLFHALQKIAAPFWVPYALFGGVLLLSYAFLRLYQYWERSTEPYLGPYAKNLTREATLGKIDPIVGRQKEVAALVDSLSDLKHHSVTPLLVGLSGVGKTEIVKALALEAQSERHPSLKGKQLFLINPSDLKEFGTFATGRYHTRLETILQRLKGKESHVILFFDEVHTLLDGPKGEASSDRRELHEKFKTLLDDRKLLCVATTTLKAYQAMIQTDEALARRFRALPVEPLGASDCRDLLTDLFHRDYPEVDISLEAIDKAIELTDKIDPDVAQPTKAKELLIEATQQVFRYHGPLQETLARLEEQRERTRQQAQRRGTLSLDGDQGRDTFHRLADLSSQIDEVERKIKEKSKKLDDFQRLQQQRKRLWRRYLRLAHELTKSSASLLQHQAEAASFLFLGSYGLQGLDRAIALQRTQLDQESIPTCVDARMVARIFEERQSDAQRLRPVVVKT